jgi:formiminotetrahydrofolate cyclodeaminase
MGIQTNVGKAVLDLGDLIKTNAVSDVARALAEKKITLSQGDLNVLANIITASVEATVRNGTDGITRLIK